MQFTVFNWIRCKRGILILTVLFSLEFFFSFLHSHTTTQTHAAIKKMMNYLYQKETPHVVQKTAKRYFSLQFIAPLVIERVNYSDESGDLLQGFLFVLWKSCRKLNCGEGRLMDWVMVGGILNGNLISFWWKLERFQWKTEWNLADILVNYNESFNGKLWKFFTGKL